MKLIKIILMLIISIVPLNIIFSQDKNIEELNKEIELKKQKIEENKIELNTEEVVKSTYFEFGGGVNYFLPVRMQSDFTTIDSINLPNCCTDYYDEFSGNGFGISLFSNFYRFNNFSLGLDLNYNILNLELIATESPVVSDNRGDPLKLNIKNYLNVDLNMINLSPRIQYNINKNFALFSSVGMNVLLNSKAEQYSDINTTEFSFESINIEPTNIWNKANADLKNLNTFNVNFEIGLLYNIYLKKNSFLSIKSFYQTYPISFSNDFNFNFDNISFGLSYTHNFEKIEVKRTKDEIINENEELERDLISINEKIKMIELQNQLKEASKYKIKYDSTQIIDLTNNKNNLIEKVRIDQFERKMVIPVLNQIFFDFGKYDLPLRYKQEIISYKERNNFEIEKLGETFDLEKVNHNIINIVGSRLLKYPDAKLKIIGNSDGSSDEISDSVGYKRALLVKSILINTFGVSDSSLIIEYREKPLNPTLSKDIRGGEENRRVEFESDNPEILKPIILDNLYKQELQNSNIIVKMNYDIPDGVKTINSKLVNYDAAQSEYYPEFDEKTPKYANLNLKLNDLYKNEELLDDLILEVEIIPNTGSPIFEEISIPIQIETVSDKRKNNEDDFVFEEYTILLPYANEGIGEFNKFTLKIIKDILTNNEISKVIVEGSTDDIGDLDYNLTLSKKRAETISEVLLEYNSNIKVEIKNNGVSNLYNNKLPEGRFLNRSVYVTIIKRSK